MAEVIVRSWRETYRGLMPDRVLDDPGFVDVRERFWTTALTDDRHRDKRIAIAEVGDAVVGVAMAGPPEPPALPWRSHLYVLYVLAAHHGTGIGADLLDAVVPPGSSAALWVASENPRALAFYRKHGFVTDGTVQVDDGVRELRMVRAGD